MTNDDTFVKITHKMVYDKLCVIEKHVEETNGKVKLNKWISSTALGLIMVMILYIVQAAI